MTSTPLSFPRFYIFDSARSNSGSVAMRCPSSRYHKFNFRLDGNDVTTVCQPMENKRGPKGSPCCTPQALVNGSPSIKSKLWLPYMYVAHWTSSGAEDAMLSNITSLFKLLNAFLTSTCRIAQPSSSSFFSYPRLKFHRHRLARPFYEYAALVRQHGVYCLANTDDRMTYFPTILRRVSPTAIGQTAVLDPGLR